MYQNYKNVELVKPSGLELKDRLVGVQRVTKVTKNGRTNVRTPVNLPTRMPSFSLKKKKIKTLT